MTIRQRLFISFSLILFIIIFIIGVFFYTIYNLNETHIAQKHRYDQMRRVEKLKEYNNSFSWIVLDIITDYEKLNIVKSRLKKADDLFKDLIFQKRNIIENSESNSEKKNLELIFKDFEIIEKLIKYELYEIVLKTKIDKDFKNFNENFGEISAQVQKLLEDEIAYLENRLEETEISREEFIDRIDLLLDKWEVDYIFLSTEDEVYRSDLKKYYGSRIFDMDRQLYDRSSTPMMKGNKNYHSYLLYVCEIFLLSQCDFLVGTPNGGFAAAVIFNGNKYKKKYICHHTF